MPKMKFCYIVICSFESGRASLEIFRNKKVETKTQFNELQEFITEQNPNLRNVFIENLILLRNE